MSKEIFINRCAFELKTSRPRNGRLQLRFKSPCTRPMFIQFDSPEGKQEADTNKIK